MFFHTVEHKNLYAQRSYPQDKGAWGCYDTKYGSDKEKVINRLTVLKKAKEGAAFDIEMASFHQRRRTLCVQFPVLNKIK
ncbi:MAG: hypothetical protein PHS57_09505 [Alphaproteobacteria bacterium]|nr:hypothetical protein [Alphaproteobacteria bacterium]